LSRAKPGSGSRAEPSFPDFAALNPGYEATKPRDGRPKSRPTPALSFSRTGFALDVTTFLQARDRLAIVRMMKLGAKTRRSNGRAWP
jgi:hypothetical protein